MYYYLSPLIVKVKEVPHYFIKISITVEMMLLILQPYHGILISKAGL